MPNPVTTFVYFKYQCEKLDVLADEVVAKVLHDDVAVTSLDTLVVDTDHHGGVGLLDAAAGRSLPSSQALTGDASDGDELPVPNFKAARRNGAGIGESGFIDFSTRSDCRRFPCPLFPYLLCTLEVCSNRSFSSPPY